MRACIAPPLTHLGSLTVAEFMRKYWQKRPLLIRRALPEMLPQMRALLGREQLFALAARDEVESRLVTSFNGRWRLARGPFARAQLPPATRKRWTLLVQGVDRHDAQANALLARFRFVPDARLDDLMMSYATQGGGVGPHIDSYDVFLLQAQGRRRWRIGRQRDRASIEGLPLEILARFRPSAEWILEPGDLLYLPPGVAHEGVAVDDCITCSIGFRAPRWQELVPPWFAWLEESTRVAGAYRDPDQEASHTPAQVPPALIDAAFARLARRQPNRSDAEAMLLVHLSEPPASVVFARPARPLTAARFARAARSHGVVLDGRTRLLYSGVRHAINGELSGRGLPAAAARAVRDLADHRGLRGSRMATLDPTQLAQWHRWYVAGWLHLAT